MPPSGPDASNSCLPSKLPVIKSVPPVPSPQRGERCTFDGECGRLNVDLPIVTYCSNKLIVVRNVINPDQPILPNHNKKLSSLVYRGHRDNTTAAKMSPSGCYIVSGDERGAIRVWSYDHEEHLCKYDISTALSGPIRDVDWDNENKRIAFVGERSGSDPNGDCAKAIQWDTGVTVGQLGNHLKGRASTVAFKGTRPFRLVTGGKDDHKTNFHKGPPFTKIPTVDSIPCEFGHTKGSVNCIRINHAATYYISVGTDKSICLYDSTTFALKTKIENIHDATIYDCSWSRDDQYIITCSGDGTCKLFEVIDNIQLIEKFIWKPAEVQYGKTFDKVPFGGSQLGCTFAGIHPTSVSLNGQISILPMPTAADTKPIKIITGHNASIVAMSIDWDNSKFYTGDSDGIICRWDLNTLEAETRLIHPKGNHDLMYVIHSGAISGLAVAKGHLMSVGWDDVMYITEPPHTNSRVKPNPISLNAQPVTIARGISIAVIVTVKGLLLAKNNDGSVSNMIPISYEPSTGCCIDQNDGIVYIGSKSDNSIYIYDVINTPTEWTLKEKHVIKNQHLKPIHSLALSNDGTKLASGDEKDICVFDVTNNEYKPIIGRGRWCFHVQRITSLSWSPNDNVLASGSADDSIYIWSIKSPMKRLHYPFGHRGGIVSLSFYKSMTKGLLLLSSGVDSVVNLWDITNDVRDKF